MFNNQAARGQRRLLRPAGDGAASVQFVFDGLNEQRMQDANVLIEG